MNRNPSQIISGKPTPVVQPPTGKASTVPSQINLDFNVEEIINKEQKVEKAKKKKNLLKLDDKLLLYSENGIKKLYDTIMSTQFKVRPSEENNLNKFIQIFRNWHFMLFPKYEIEYFMSKVAEIGKMSSGRAYFSRLRKIYKGEETWDVMYNEQEQILAKQTKEKANAEDTKNKTITDYMQNKAFVEDKTNFPLIANQNELKKVVTVSSVSDKLNGVAISNNRLSRKVDNDNVDDTDVQELVFEQMQDKNKFDLEVDERDYDNFDHFSNHSEHEEKVEYKNEKRTFTQAFGENYQNSDVSLEKNPYEKQRKI